MKAILGIGISILAIWLAVCLLAGQAGAQYPSWVDANGWSPYGGYTIQEYHGYLPYPNNYGQVYYSMYDSYGMPAGSAYYGYDTQSWGYWDGYNYYSGPSYWNPYSR